MRFKGHRVQYPRTDGEQQAVAQWLEAYEASSERFATCKFIKELGRSRTNDIIKLHDKISKAQEQMKLA
jgi:hypothetical protein